jgi:Flp pilus assembly protein TadG
MERSKAARLMWLANQATPAHRFVGFHAVMTQYFIQYFRFQKNRRGSISVVAALTLPILVGVMGLGIDVSYWATIRSDLQRTADVSAMAGAAKYASTFSASSALTTAANVAELNGFPAGTRTSIGTTTLTDSYGNYSATITFSSPANVTVTTQRAVPLMFTKVFLSESMQTVTATAVAQVTPRLSGSQSCVLALNGLSDGITTSDDLTISGGKNTNVVMSGCDLRSNASVGFNGSPNVGVPDIAASGTISGSYTPICPGQTSCDQQLTALPQVPDPFAGTYGSQLNVSTNTTSQPNSSSFGPAPSGTAYDGLSFGSGNYNLSPGIYYVEGDISFNGNGTVTGTGVTFIMSGSLQVNGSSTLNLTAPSSGTTKGLLIGSSSGSVTFNGNSTQNLLGAIYMPNGSVTMTGNTSSGSASLNCLVAIAQTATFAGSSSFGDSGCASLGVPAVYDLPGVVRLIQ